MEVLWRVLALVKLMMIKDEFVRTMGCGKVYKTTIKEFSQIIVISFRFQEKEYATNCCEQYFLRHIKKSSKMPCKRTTSANYKDVVDIGEY